MDTEEKDSANACSKCGACLAACAVYQLLLEEPASPRGRLATLTALKEGRLEDTPENRRFIEACMLCGRCEAACHKGVKGREAILDVRRIWWQEKKTPLWKRLLTHWYGPAGLRRLRFVWGFMARTPLRRFLLLPRAMGSPLKKNRPDSAGSTGLFPGCVLGVFYPDLIRGIEGLMREDGSAVQIMSGFDCCGFPALSQGNIKTFEQKKRHNETLIREQGVATLVLPCATGLMAMRAHYTAEAAYEDLGVWLQNQKREWTILHPDILNAPPGFWLFHRPCHQPKRDETRGWMGALSRCKGIRMPAREETDCCGFGGLFSIGYPVLSRSILADRQNRWRQQGVGGIITDCPGCYMQFREVGMLPVLFFTEPFVKPAEPAETP